MKITSVSVTYGERRSKNYASREISLELTSTVDADENPEEVRETLRRIAVNYVRSQFVEMEQVPLG